MLVRWGYPLAKKNHFCGLVGGEGDRLLAWGVLFRTVQTTFFRCKRSDIPALDVRYEIVQVLSGLLRANSQMPAIKNLWLFVLLFDRL